MEKIIFFDLEGTLIPEWDQREILLPLDHPILKEWILNQMPFRAGLFSFAVLDDKDLIEFNKSTRPLINKHLLFDFDDDLIVLDKNIEEIVNKANFTPFMTAEENRDIFKKEGIIQIIWKNLFFNDNTHIILLDDTVEDVIINRTTRMDHSIFDSTCLSTVTHPVENNKLQLVNPWSVIRNVN